MKKLITMGIFAVLSGLFPCQANADTNVVCSDEGFQTTLDIDNFKWTRQPESCVIKGDTIEVVTNLAPTFGNAPIIISATTTHLFSRWRQRRNFSASS